jgi:nitroreductase
MSVSDLLERRISVRAFLSDPVDAVTVHALLDAARWAPSGGNLQPWKVLAVAGTARDAVVALAKERLAANPEGEVGAYRVYPEKLGEPYRSRRFKVGEDMYARLGIPREDRAARLRWFARNYEFFGAPVGLFFVIDRTMGHGQWAHLGMFMQSLALAPRSVASRRACRSRGRCCATRCTRISRSIEAS